MTANRRALVRGGRGLQTERADELVAVARLAFLSFEFENGAVAGQADDDQDGMDIEFARALVEPFMRPTPALTRLIQAIKETPELRELTGWADLSPQAKTLVKRWYRGAYRESRRPAGRAIEDHRGPGVREVETVQTFLTASEIDRLVADYQAGVGVLELADRYGIHRATVAAHLRRRSTPRRSLGLDVNERAEAVRLFREGMSLRAIGRRLGVDRKSVRASMVEAEVSIRP